MSIAVVYYLGYAELGSNLNPVNLLPVRPWASHVISPSVSFLCYEMRFVVLPLKDRIYEIGTQVLATLTT